MTGRFYKKSEKGFTLIEILIVVVIVAILAAISVPIYVDYVKSARASDAKTSINAIWQATQVYYQDKGTWPATTDDLENERYLTLSDATKLQWTFQVVGAPPTTIVATSTEQMRGGAGQQVTYHVHEGVWSGYGQQGEQTGSEGQ
jgi:type IV pilus assembly protein PilA